MPKKISQLLIPAFLLLSLSLKSQSKEELTFNLVKTFYTSYDIDDKKALVYDKTHHIISTAGINFDITKVTAFTDSSKALVYLSCGYKDCITCTAGTTAQKQNGNSCAIASGFKFTTTGQAIKFAGLLNELKKEVNK